MKTVLQVICEIERWQGGTLAQAIQAYKNMPVEKQKLVVDKCKDIAENKAGKRELILFYKVLS